MVASYSSFTKFLDTPLSFTLFASSNNSTHVMHSSFLRLRPAVMLCLVLCIFFVHTPYLRAQDASKEYAIKAGMLYNFLKFVDTWPDASNITKNKKVTVCIYGNDPFGGALRPIQKRKVRGMPIQLQKNISLDNITSCDLVFIGTSERNALDSVLSAVGNAPVLTVSDIRGFAARGGVIGFVTQGGKVRFEVNKKAMGNSGIRLSAKLLELATIVG